MKNWKRPKALPVYILTATLAVIVSACGASTTTFQNSTGALSSSTGGSFVYPTPSPSPSTALAPALSYEILNTGIGGSNCTDCLTGQGGNYPTYSTLNASGGYINTDNLLQVQVTVQSGGELSAAGTAASGTSYSNFNATYDCASFDVSVVDQNGNTYGSQSTGMLAVAGSEGCLDETINTSTGLPNSTQLLDFSGNVAQGPHGGLNVQVQTLDYDFYCKLLANYWGSLSAAQAYAPEYYDLWCPYKTVYKNHSISAQLQITINGTVQ